MKTNTQTSELIDIYCTDQARACRLALRRTSHLPENERMQAINDLLGMHGVEAIRGDWQNGYWCDIVADYCNTGDTYQLTVMRVRGDHYWQRSRFIVTSWGDWVEQNSQKYGVL